MTYKLSEHQKKIKAERMRKYRVLHRDRLKAYWDAWYQENGNKLQENRWKKREELRIQRQLQRENIKNSYREVKGKED